MTEGYYRCFPPCCLPVWDQTPDVWIQDCAASIKPKLKNKKLLLIYYLLSLSPHTRLLFKCSKTGSLCLCWAPLAYLFKICIAVSGRVLSTQNSVRLLYRVCVCVCVWMLLCLVEIYKHTSSLAYVWCFVCGGAYPQWGLQPEHTPTQCGRVSPWGQTVTTLWDSFLWVKLFMMDEVMVRDQGIHKDDINIYYYDHFQSHQFALS